MGDVVLSTEAGHFLAGEISSVVGDDSVGDPEAAYYVLSEELGNLLLADLRERHCLNPFLLSSQWLPIGNAAGFVLGKRSDHVRSPLHEGP